MVSQSDKVTLAISRDLVRKARGKAIAEGTTLSKVVTEFLERWLAEGAPPSPPPTNVNKPKRKPK